MSENPMFELSWKKKKYGDKLNIVIIHAVTSTKYGDFS